MERLFLCAGSWSMEQKAAALGVPELERSFAESGTRVHSAYAGEEADLDISEEKAAEIAKIQSEAVLKDYFGDLSYNITREQRVWLHRGIRPVASCRYDLLAIAKDEVDGREIRRGLLLDLKSGWGKGVTEAPSNWQLKTEAAIVGSKYNLETLGVALIQPRVKSVKDIQIAEFDVESIALAIVEVWGVIEQSKNPDAPRTPSLKACEWCKAKFICPEARGALALPPVTTLALNTPEQNGKLVEAAQLAMKIAKDVLDVAKAVLAENPAAIAGYKLVEGNTQKTITDPMKCFNNFSSMLTGSEFTEVCTVSKEKLKTKYKEKSGLKGKSLDETFESLIADCVTPKQNAPKLEKL